MTAPKTPLPVLDPTTMRVAGEVEVDARLAVPVPVEQPDAHAQRLPTPNDRPAIVDLVLARPLSPAARSVIEARDAIGRVRYGTRLQAFNGRDVTRDLTEEAADAVIYAMQGLEEARREVTRAKWERRFAMAVALLEECVGPASGASILALVAAHNVIAGDELPGVLAALDVARNGPEEQRGDALTPGSTWTAPDGTVYDVVRGEEVGDRPRWWVPIGIHADQVGLEHPGELHTGMASSGASGLLALVLRHACAAADCAARTEAEVTACMRPDCDADGGLTVGDVDVFSLEMARAMLTNLERLEPGQNADDARCDLWVELRAACDEVERLRARVSGLEVDLAAAERRGDAHAEEAERLRTALDRSSAETAANLAMRAEIVRALGCSNDRITDMVSSDAAAAIKHRAALIEAVEANLPPTENGESLARIANSGTIIVEARDQADANRTEAQRLERENRLIRARLAAADDLLVAQRQTISALRRARKAEARVAVLTEERDGLTLRLGAKVQKQVERSKAKARTRKGGR